jgi:membrane protein YqaA with SNARE-associated domain
MIRRLYDYVIALSGRPGAMKAMAAVSFTESSFFPIPPDAMLIPMILARRDQAWRIATVCTIASVIGGIVGYAIGYYLLETLGGWIIRLYGLEAGLADFRARYAEWGLWIILIKGMTPIPYKLVTIASGAAHFDIWVFTIASIVTRGARFFLVAALLWRFGAPIREFVERRLTLLTTLFVVFLVGGFAVVRFVI